MAIARRRQPGPHRQGRPTDEPDRPRREEGPGSLAHNRFARLLSALLGTNISNVGGMFVILEPFENAKATRSSAMGIARERRAVRGHPHRPDHRVRGAAIDGRGTTGGFKFQVQDRSGAGLRALQGSVQNLADQGNADPRLVGLFSSFTGNQPQIFVEIDRDKLKAQKVSLNDVNQTLQAYLGGLYVNDVTLFNRNWQVNVQADARFRMRVEDIGRMEVRNAEGQRVPLWTLVNISRRRGPAISTTTTVTRPPN